LSSVPKWQTRPKLSATPASDYCTLPSQDGSFPPGSDAGARSGRQPDAGRWSTTSPTRTLQCWNGDLRADVSAAYRAWISATTCWYGAHKAGTGLIKAVHHPRHSPAAGNPKPSSTGMAAHRPSLRWVHAGCLVNHGKGAGVRVDSCSGVTRAGPAGRVAPPEEGVWWFVTHDLRVRTSIRAVVAQPYTVGRAGVAGQQGHSRWAGCAGVRLLSGSCLCTGRCLAARWSPRPSSPGISVAKTMGQASAVCPGVIAV
jgi:hypothetical protein